MRDRTRGALAALLLLAVTVGLPVTLAVTVGNPLHAWTSVRAGDTSDGDVIAVLAAVFYLAWASFVVPVLLEVATVVLARATRRPRREIRLPLLRPQQEAARALLGAVLLLLPAGTATATAAAVASLPAASPRHVNAAALTPYPAASHADRPPAGPAAVGQHSYVIPDTGGMRDYWTLAEHYLGDGQRWREIWHLNAGRVHADGSVMDSPRRLAAGWTILIPSSETRGETSSGAGTHDVVVRPGDTLSGLAADDGITDWQSVWPANDGRIEPGGRHFDDPNLILPGWSVDLPDTTSQRSVSPSAGPESQRPQTVQPHRSHPKPTPGPHAGVRSERHVPPATPPASSPAPPTPSNAPTSTLRTPGHDNHIPDPLRVPLPAPLQVGLAAAAAVAVLDRARRIAQRRRRHGHRLPPSPPHLAEAETKLRRDAGRADPTAAAVALAAALAADADIALRAVVARDDGSVDLLLDDPADAPAPSPFVATDGGWRLPAAATGFTYAVDDAADPRPALAPIGLFRDGAVMVDLAAIGPVGVAGDPHAVQGYLAGLVQALAGAPWADRLSLHVPPRLAAAVGPLDRVTVEDTPSLPPLTVGEPGPAGSSAELTELGWCTTPVHLYCGWTPADSIDDLLRAANTPGTQVLVVLDGLHPQTATWTLTGDEITLPQLTDPVTVTTGTPEMAAVTELLTHTATVADVPADDPQLPDLAADAPAAQEPTAVQLNLLGPVELAGSPSPRRSQTLNLLTYLALHRRGVDRDQIATALWPEQVVSSKTLRNRIHEARVLVGHAISDGPRWRLDETVTTDWQRFTALAAGTPAEQHEALALVRGRPFEGLDGTEWIDHEGFRTEVEAAIVDLALTVAERDYTAGDLNGAYTAARAGLTASRYEERLHRIAIRAAQAQGSTGKVRALQHEMRSVLDTDIEPDDQMQSDTVALYGEITAGRRTARTVTGGHT